MTFFIIDWKEKYENNRTRDMKYMTWIPIPNKMDGDGYTELICDHPNGTAHYGAWLAILQIASRCGMRGTLLRDGGRPHDIASISRISRIPESIISEAIPRLRLIGWLGPSLSENRVESSVCITPQEPALFPQGGAGFPQATDYGTERNGTERNIENHCASSKHESGNRIPDSERKIWFSEFWGFVWAKIGVDAARGAWMAKVHSREEADRLIEAAKRQGKGILEAAAERAAKDGGKIRPLHPATWIRQGRYEDEEITALVPRATNGHGNREEETSRIFHEMMRGEMERHG